MKMGTSLSKYLKAADLKKPVLMHVERIEEEEVGDDWKHVLYFVESESGVVLGPTTKTQLIEAFGGDDETDNWIGMPIVVYNDENVQFQGRRTGGIRFRAPKGEHKRIEVQPKSSGIGNGAAAPQGDIPF